MLHKFGRFFQLPPADQRLILTIGTILPLLVIALRLFGFNRVYAALEQHRVNMPRIKLDDKQEITHLKRRLRQISQRHPFSGRCLTESLTLWWLLRNRGIETDLRFGQRYDQGRFESHAWVEHLGQPINASQHIYQHFTPFAETIRPK